MNMGYSASGLGVGLNQYYSSDLPDFCRCLKLEAGLYFLGFLSGHSLVGVSKYTLKTGTTIDAMGETV